MLEWQDTAILLGRRKYGETDVVITALTRAHGRHAGLVKGGISRRLRGGLEPGTIVTARWRARLEEHLGTFSCEPQTAISPLVMEDAGRLAALVSTCGLLDSALPEREPHPELHDLCCALLERLSDDDWAAAYADFERGLLESLGFGLHLDACVVTGATEDLRFVSPKSGGAVCGDAGEPYRDRLLPFPEVFRRKGAVADTDVVAGLAVTGYFLRRHVFEVLGRSLPEARDRLIDRLARGGKTTNVALVG
jgi:DNA repair protein RecO (recombination protein O)